MSPERKKLRKLIRKASHFSDSSWAEVRKGKVYG